MFPETRASWKLLISNLRELWELRRREREKPAEDRGYILGLRDGAYAVDRLRSIEDLRPGADVALKVSSKILNDIADAVERGEHLKPRASLTPRRRGHPSIKS